MYDAVFTTWIGPALLILAVFLIVLAMRGDLARQAQRAGFAVAALAFGSAAYIAPVDWAKVADPLLLDGVTSMQEGFLGQIGLGDRDTLPTVLVDQVVYQNWLRGEFGAPDVPQAQQFGRNLLRAQTFTKAESPRKATGDLAQQKKNDFATIAASSVTATLPQGKSGSRIGDGLLAVVEAVCIALFQLLSKVLVLVAMLMIRLLVMTAPAAAVVAILKPEILPAPLRGRCRDRQHPGRRGVGRTAPLLVVSLFRPGLHRLRLAPLVTGVVTVVLWRSRVRSEAGVDGSLTGAVRRHVPGAVPARCRACGSACGAARSTTGRPGGGTSDGAPPRQRHGRCPPRTGAHPIPAQATRSPGPHRSRRHHCSPPWCPRPPTRAATGFGRHRRAADARRSGMTPTPSTTARSTGVRMPSRCGPAAPVRPAEIVTVPTIASTASTVDRSG
jgi:hypothetical protein